MTTTAEPAVETLPAQDVPAPVLEQEPVVVDLLVEDVSIDGMCGVY